ncbi:unnamed protein product [Owenia fusiformis]|uniref:Phospholipid/glycerol acyltransferase domain-containing protein n=1 Tax=Owenia fusiformis TaxID=6347 RepID=A0A8S4MXZ9_OWEFU|nr:unnamed protein product [Owenia fusiformis]
MWMQLAIFLHIYKYRHKLKDAYAKDFWDGARKTLAALWDAQGWIWHGYEIHGFENIPDEGPALIIYYHGALPVDYYYVLAKCILYKHRKIRAVGDRFLWKIPGFKLLLEVFHVSEGSIQNSVELMKQGNLMAIAPGGVREAFFSDENYGLLWGKRVGFAKIAMEAKVPVIPMFTQNCREAFRSLGLFKGWLRKLYEKTRLPLVPLYGGFPVKLKTFIGKPIHHEANTTPEQFAQKIQIAVQDLIKTHQLIPGNILRAMYERFS